MYVNYNSSNSARSGKEAGPNMDIVHTDFLYYDGVDKIDERSY